VNRFEGWKTKVKKSTNGYSGSTSLCGTSFAEEKKNWFSFALKGGQTWFLARETRLCGLDYRSDVAFFFLLESFVPVLVHSERE
jgi:hypothetical protein